MKFYIVASPESDDFAIFTNAKDAGKYLRSMPHHYTILNEEDFGEISGIVIDIKKT